MRTTFSGGMLNDFISPAILARISCAVGTLCWAIALEIAKASNKVVRVLCITKYSFSKLAIHHELINTQIIEDQTLNQSLIN
jgi:hypothetical protein